MVIINVEWEQVCEEIESGLRIQARKLSLDEHEAQDLFQEGTLSAWKAFVSGRWEDPVRYCARSARNRMLDLIKARTRFRKLNVKIRDIVKTDDGDLDEGLFEAEDTTILRDLRIDLNEAMKELTPLQVFILLVASIGKFDGPTSLSRAFGWGISKSRHVWNELKKTIELF